MPNIRVIKPFTFSYPLGRGEKLAREHAFAVGDHEIDDVMASHPWIFRHFADGCIETPEQARQRAQQAATTAKKAQDDADYWKLHAEQAFKRAEVLSLVQSNGDPAALERELNTPVNRLGAEQGAGITSTVPGSAGSGSVDSGANGGDQRQADEAARAEWDRKEAEAREIERKAAEKAEGDRKAAEAQRQVEEQAPREADERRPETGEGGAAGDSPGGSDQAPGGTGEGAAKAAAGADTGKAAEGGKKNNKK